MTEAPAEEHQRLRAGKRLERPRRHQQARFRRGGAGRGRGVERGREGGERPGGDPGLATEQDRPVDRRRDAVAVVREVESQPEVRIERHHRDAVAGLQFREQLDRPELHLHQAGEPHLGEVGLEEEHDEAARGRRLGARRDGLLGRQPLGERRGPRHPLGGLDRRRRPVHEGAEVGRRQAHHRVAAAVHDADVHDHAPDLDVLTDPHRLRGRRVRRAGDARSRPSGRPARRCGRGNGSRPAPPWRPTPGSTAGRRGRRCPRRR